MSGKKIASTAAIIILYVTIIYFALFMIFTGRALYLSGNFISEYAVGFGAFAVLMMIHIIIKCVGFFGKGKENSEERGAFDIVMIIASCIILVLAVLGLIRQIGKAYNERIDLPDGNIILLNEKVSSGNETTSVDVYRISGIIARKFGGIYDENVLSDNFLEESDWDYIYDEDEKLLTLFCLFDDEDSIFYDEELGIGIWEESYILE